MGAKEEGSDNKKNEGQEGKGEGDGGVHIVVLKFDMHCEGCAKKIKRSIQNYPGVESVKTDFSSSKLTVVGKVDPVKIKEKIEEKSKKKVEILSLQTNKPSNNKEGGGEKKSEEKKSNEKKSQVKTDNKKSEDKKEKEKEKEKSKEPPVSTVLLKTRVHCEGCAHKIRKIVGKYDGVQDVNVDLQKDTITIKGTMNMNELLPYLNIKLKRDVALASAKKDETISGDKKPKESSGSGSGGEKPKEKSGGGGGSEKGKGGEKKESSGGSSNSSAENVTKIEVNRMEYNPYGYGPYGYGSQAYMYDPRQHGENYGHQVVEYWHAPDFSQPPQMFSDENPNACSVM